MSPGTSRRPAQPQRQLPERFVCPSRATIDHPDTASITVMSPLGDAPTAIPFAPFYPPTCRSSASRPRQSTLTVGRGGARPTPSTAPPRHVSPMETEHPCAGTAGVSVHDNPTSPADRLVTGDKPDLAAVGVCCRPPKADGSIAHRGIPAPGRAPRLVTQCRPTGAPEQRVGGIGVGSVGEQPADHRASRAPGRFSSGGWPPQRHSRSGSASESRRRWA